MKVRTEINLPNDHKEPMGEDRHQDEELVSVCEEHESQNSRGKFEETLNIFIVKILKVFLFLPIESRRKRPSWSFAHLFLALLFGELERKKPFPRKLKSWKKLRK